MIETGIESKEDEKNKFFELADQLTTSSDPAERLLRCRDCPWARLALDIWESSAIVIRLVGSLPAGQEAFAL